ncbi:MAG: hypothetical protein Q4C96_03885 [Planctomycetia bacterium]|nr:hypothetical protein [Planctomycetia bacterium]
MRFSAFNLSVFTFFIILSLPPLIGCRDNVIRTPYASYISPTETRLIQNPTTFHAPDPYILWETLVDVVRLYFWDIQEEYPCQRNGGLITEGLLVTYPQVGATCLEPWRRDSVTHEERKEATLQSIRRTARIRVRPVDGGYSVEIRVFKELEDLVSPSKTRLPSATFRLDTELPDVHDPIAVTDYRAGWIPKGRDEALEHEMLLQLQARLPRR